MSTKRFSPVYAGWESAVTSREIYFGEIEVSFNKDNPYEDPQTWSMDLGRSYEIDKVVLYWENAAAKKYKIYVSENKTDWMEVGMDILFHSGFAPKLINPASP